MHRADSIGSLEPGKQADLVVFDTGDYREIPYYFRPQPVCHDDQAGQSDFTRNLVIHFTLVVNQAILGLAPLAAKDRGN